MAKGSAEQFIARSRDPMDPPGLLAQAFDPLTRNLLYESGLEPGMRVLDVSSSTGDLAFLARELVGEQGQVIGFDTSAGTVAYANERAAFRGLSNVSFVEAGFDDLPYGEDLDAIIGRIVLMYRPDPVADLQGLVRCLRPGGLAVFQELDMLPGKTVPPALAVDDAREWMLDTFASSGIELEMGPKLYATFTAAGLSPPEMRVDGLIGGADSLGPALVAHVARMLLPQAEALGTLRAKDMQIETLEERMRADLAATGGVMSTPLLIGAWARLPA